MAEREGSWWSRGWGTVSVLGFAVYLGAAVYEAAVVAPLWSLTPPASVSAWAAVKLRPDPSQLFQSLLAIIAISTLLAWISGVTERGWRRWWLTLALLCAGSLVAIVVVLLTPCERALFGTAALGDRDAAGVVALTGDWVRASALRMAALLVGAWTAYRAQVSGMLGSSRASVRDVLEESAGRPREFAFGDEPEDEMTLGEEAVNPRERWMTSLPGRRRTAKK